MKKIECNLYPIIQISRKGKGQAQSTVEEGKETARGKRCLSMVGLMKVGSPLPNLLVRLEVGKLNPWPMCFRVMMIL